MRIAITDANVFIDFVDALVLTGDKKLRRTIEAAGREVHGVVWLFDMWIEAGVLSRLDAAEKLDGLIRMNPFMPAEECLDRIVRWRR
jgi:hypothetical protein